MTVQVGIVFVAFKCDLTNSRSFSHSRKGALPCQRVCIEILITFQQVLVSEILIKAL